MPPPQASVISWGGCLALQGVELNCHDDDDDYDDDDDDDDDHGRLWRVTRTIFHTMA